MLGPRANRCPREKLETGVCTRSRRPGSFDVSVWEDTLQPTALKYLRWPGNQRPVVCGRGARSASCGERVEGS